MRFLRLGIVLIWILTGGFFIRQTSYVVHGQGDDSATVISLIHDDNTYDTRLFLPSNYDEADDPLPLIIAFHPSGGDGASMARITGFDTYAEANNVIVAYPSSQFGYWDYGYGLPEWEVVGFVLDDFGFSEVLYSYLLENYNVDTSRVYIVGYSNGSRMVMRLACEHSDWFAGAAMVAAGMTTEVAAICPTTAQLPVLYQHGTDDQTVLWEGEPLTEGGNVISYAFSAPDTTTFWALQNGCALEPIVSDVPDLNPDDSITIRLAEFNDCESGFPVSFYAVINGGHGWVGAPSVVETDLVASGDTSAYVWSFFGLDNE